MTRASDQQVEDVETAIRGVTCADCAFDVMAHKDVLLAIIREVREGRKNDRFLQSQRMTHVRGGRGRR